MLLLDFCKAFDKVPYSRLYYKLQYYGIRSIIFAWIKTFLSTGHKQLILDNKQRNSCAVLSGVPQGTVLAPLLF